MACIDGNLKEKWSQFIKNKAYLATTGIFFVIIYSGIYSELTPYYWDRVRVALPFLILPFAFSSLPKLSERQFQLVFYWLLIAVTLSSIGTFIYYLSDFQFYTKELEHGRPIPTPIHHIRFSLLIAYTIIVGFWLLINQVIYKYNWEKWLIWACIFFLFIWIHILSVRSGIVVLYVTLFLSSLQYVVKTKRYLLGLSVVLLILAAPFLAYTFVPSFKNRIDYAIYDFKNSQEGETKNFSDGERMVSLQIGMEIGNENPWFGIGIGNLDNEVKRIYTEKYPDFIVKRPHNQLLFFYAAIGIIGTIAFLLFFLYPLFYQKNYKDELFLAFYVIIFLSFMVEATIGNAIGTAFYIFFLLIGLKRI
ncbi:MAG: O-antigen ligase family protein [Saprospiraceae bacterium]|nr:O-antigen ligase family protein [Saprospiraceae bacterium]